MQKCSYLVFRELLQGVEHRELFIPYSLWHHKHMHYILMKRREQKWDETTEKLASRTNIPISTSDEMKILFLEIPQETPRNISFFRNFRTDFCQETNSERSFGQWRGFSVYSLEIFFNMKTKTTWISWGAITWDDRQLRFEQFLRCAKQILSEVFWGL